jgi:glycosyltransferase Alg8
MFLAVTHAAYWAFVITMFSALPVGTLGYLHANSQTIFILGFLGTWRYSWAALNFTRAAIFYNWVYPRRKARAIARFAERGVPCHAYFLVTTYMVDPEATLLCYRALFKAASRTKDGATIVASVCDGADERLIRGIWDQCPHDLSRVKLVIDRIRPNGKRDAMAKTLKIIAAEAPTKYDICIFVDGDTCVPEDVIAQSAPWFTRESVGALTTDEGVIIHRDNLFKDWFILRFNQRQVMMSSMGLSRHVLTLTGRMSVFRADLCTHPEFVNGVNHDFLDHWRLGRVTFLTGDDKSTWYWLLRNGWEMVYLPDVRSWSMETQPRPTFFDSAKTLMVRWFGNMMRTNGRALQLGPGPMGFFTWWSILDQRVSIWTTLVGPISVIWAAITVSPTIIPLYIGWVLMTRYVFCAIISAFRGTWFPVTHPPILYFGQIVGALVKSFVLFRLDRQKWTRQASGGGTGGLSLSARILAIDSTVHHALALVWLTVFVIMLGQI